MIDHVEEINKCRQILDLGGIIAFPTDTLYGIASKITSEKAFGTDLSAQCNPLNKGLLITWSRSFRSFSIRCTQQLVMLFVENVIFIFCKKSSPLMFFL